MCLPNALEYGVPQTWITPRSVNQMLMARMDRAIVAPHEVKEMAYHKWQEWSEEDSN